MITLGIVSPYRPEINRTLSGGLGIVPNDFEMGRMYGWYTPVQHGWINGRERWFPGGNLGDSATAAAFAAAESGNAEQTAMLRELVAAEKLKATMAVVSGIGVAIAASVAVFRYFKSKGQDY